MRAGQIRLDAAKRLHDQFAQKLEELANADKIGRNKAGKPNQQEAADLIGIPQSMVNQLLKGKRIPGADYLAVISATLGVSSDELLGLPASDVERARRIAFDFFDPEMQRRVFDLLKTRFDGVPKELQAAELEAAPHMPTEDLPQKSGEETGKYSRAQGDIPDRRPADNVPVRPTKRVKRVKSPR